MFEPSPIAALLTTEVERARGAGPEGGSSAWVDLAGQCEQMKRTLDGLQTMALARVAGYEDVEREDGTVEEEYRGLGHQRLDAADLVSDRLGLTHAAASARVDTAVDLASRLPTVVEAMTEGRIDQHRARIVSEELREATPEVCDEVMSRLEQHLGAQPGPSLRRRVRRILQTVDADFLRAKAERAREGRSLRRWAGEAGVDEWSGSFPVRTRARHGR